MKSTRALIMILVSLLAGATAVWLAARWAGQQTAGNTTRIVVATRDIDPGAKLDPTMLQLLAWPSGSVPVGAVTELQKTQGRVASASLVKGEPLLESKLAPEGATGGLSSTIATGKRAISIQVNEIVGVAGYIRPGSLVDVLVNTREGSDRMISKIVLEQIPVLAVAQDDKRDQTKPKVVSTVTLEVTPHQAELIDLSRHIGTLSLVLRNPLDRDDAKTAGARTGELLSGKDEGRMPVATKDAAAVAPPSKPAARAQGTGAGSSGRVEVIRGVQKANSAF
jgi:pilus assembly protein CpaB